MAEQMKPSGIDWIGDIPESWRVTRLQTLFDQVKEKNSGTREKNLLSLSYGKIVKKDIEGSFGLIPESFDTYNIIKKNDIVLRLTDMQNDQVSLRTGLVKEEKGIITSAYVTIRLKSGSPSYYHWYLYAFDTSKQIYAFGQGVRQSLTFEELKKILILLPSPKEQQAIADFLDKECAQIDSISADLEKQIALLQQYKKSLITETVTKGLDKSVPMKDSGIEWIGEIPNTWDCKKMKYVISEPLQYGANEAGDDYKEDYPRYIRITDITEENSLKDDGKLSLSLDIAKPYLLKDGDLLFARSGATVGKTFYYTSNYGTCAFAGYLIKARFNQDKMNPKFVYYTTLGIGYENWKNTVFTQATIQNIGADKYAQLYITVPSTKEQNEIIAYLDTQCKAIDDVIHSKYQQLSTIQQHKKSLIYEYVTGKKRVKEVR